jgi:hypothetical protein
MHNLQPEHKSVSTIAIRGSDSKLGLDKIFAAFEAAPLA